MLCDKMKILFLRKILVNSFSKLTSSLDFNMMCGSMYAIILCKENMGLSCLFFQETHFCVSKLEK